MLTSPSPFPGTVPPVPPPTGSLPSLSRSSRVHSPPAPRRARPPSSPQLLPALNDVLGSARLGSPPARCCSHRSSRFSPPALATTPTSNTRWCTSTYSSSHLPPPSLSSAARSNRALGQLTLSCMAAPPPPPAPPPLSCSSPAPPPRRLPATSGTHSPPSCVPSPGSWSWPLTSSLTHAPASPPSTPPTPAQHRLAAPPASSIALMPSLDRVSAPLPPPPHSSTLAQAPHSPPPCATPDALLLEIPCSSP